MIPLMLNGIGYTINYHWQIYLPVFVLSMLAIIPMIILSSKKKMLRSFFLLNILMLIFVQFLFIIWSDSKQAIMITLLIYFIAFNFLEANSVSSNAVLLCVNGSPEPISKYVPFCFPFNSESTNKSWKCFE